MAGTPDASGRRAGLAAARAGAARHPVRLLGLWALLLIAGCGNEGDRGAGAEPGDGAEAAGPEAATPSFLSDGANGQQGQAAPPGERLLAPLPEDWQPSIESLNPSLRLLEFTPPQRDGAHARERLTFESFPRELGPGELAAPRPIETLQRIAERRRERCPELEHFNTFMGEENGYATAKALMICREETDGAGEDGEASARVAMVKAIEGNEHIYVITRQRELTGWRALDAASEDDGERADSEALAEIVATLSLYLRSVSLCDDDRAEAHPCATPDG